MSHDIGMFIVFPSYGCDGQVHLLKKDNGLVFFYRMIIDGNLIVFSRHNSGKFYFL